MHRRFTILLSILMIAIMAIPAGAYTIYLKDGSRLIAREKHRLEDGKVIIVLQNGTRTFIEASEIDITRTEQANLGDYGTALVLEDGQLVEARDTSKAIRNHRRPQCPSSAPHEGRTTCQYGGGAAQ